MEKQRAVELRSTLDEILRGHPNISRYGSMHVRPEDVEKLTPEEIELMRLYSGLQDAALKYTKNQRAIGVRG